MKAPTHPATRKAHHEHAVQRAVAALNQALLSAALDGVSLELTLGKGPNRMGPLNETERWWVQMELHDDDR